MNALRVLEDLSWSIKPEELEEIRRKENWRFWQDGNPEAVREQRNIGDDTFYRLRNNAHRVETMMKTLQTLMDAAMEVHQELVDPIRLRPQPALQSRSITALPGEVLGKILAATVSPGERKRAIGLSHLCRHFREVALGEPSMWTTIHSKALRAELDAFLSRCGDNTDLHIVMKLNDGCYIPGFLEKCLPLAHRWKSLTVIDPLHGSTFPKEESVNRVLKLIDGDAHRYLGRLETLRVEDEQSSYLSITPNPWADEPEPEDESRFTPSWISPLLGDLYLIGYVPTFAPAFESIKTFTFSIFVHRHNFRTVTADFHSFLAAVPSIEDLHLEVHDASNPDVVPLLLTIVQCSSVRSFSLSLKRFTVGSAGERVVFGLTRMLSFPLLDQLSISIEFNHRERNRKTSDLNGTMGIQLPDSLSNALFPNNIIFPYLTSLTYNLSIHVPLYGPAVAIDALPKLFPIPLNRVPNLSSLTLKTFVKIQLTRTYDPVHLQVLHLRECNEMDGDALRQIVESLREADVWNGIQRVVVEDCKALQYETALDVVGMDKLRFIQS